MPTDWIEDFRQTIEGRLQRPLRQPPRRIGSLSQGLREAIRLAQAPENFAWQGSFLHWYANVFYPATGYQLRDGIQQFLRATNWSVMSVSTWLWVLNTRIDRQKLLNFLHYFHLTVGVRDLARTIYLKSTMPTRRRVSVPTTELAHNRGIRWIR